MTRLAIPGFAFTVVSYSLIVVSLAGCDKPKPEGAASSQPGEPGPQASVTPVPAPPPQRTTTSGSALPEYYGLYALDSGKSMAIKGDHEPAQNFTSKVQFLLFDKRVKLGGGTCEIRSVSGVAQGSVPPVLAKPVPEHDEMVQFVPSEELSPGAYILRLGEMSIPFLIEQEKVAAWTYPGADAQWMQVQNVIQRRSDLVPNIVSTVSGAANFDKSALTEITEARASLGKVTIDPNSSPTDPAKLAEFDRAQEQLGIALSHLFDAGERYPDLESSANFIALKAQLEKTETRIFAERTRYNEVIHTYNAAIKSFPMLQPKPYFAEKKVSTTESS